MFVKSLFALRPSLSRFKNVPRKALAPVPLFPMQPVLRRIVTGVVERHPDLFDRLGEHSQKRFVIDPENLPFVFVLRPDPKRPSLRACRRNDVLAYDAKITGTFLTLLDLADGQMDSDALFFSRELVVEGDTEAVVVLRNALDDLDESLIEDLVGTMGIFAPLARRVLGVLHRIRASAFKEEGSLNENAERAA